MPLLHVFIFPRVGGRGRTMFRGRADSASAAAFSTIFGGRIWLDLGCQPCKTGAKSPFRRRNGCIVCRLDVGDTNFPRGTMERHLPLLT